MHPTRTSSIASPRVERARPRYLRAGDRVVDRRRRARGRDGQRSHALDRRGRPRNRTLTIDLGAVRPSPACALRRSSAPPAYTVVAGRLSTDGIAFTSRRRFEPHLARSSCQNGLRKRASPRAGALRAPHDQSSRSGRDWSSAARRAGGGGDRPRFN
jgi:hypothetical protein